MATIPVQRISPDAFAPYGRVVQAPSGPPTAADSTFSYWSDLAAYHIVSDTEIGLCTVYGDEPGPVTWVERHEQTPELLIPIDAPFILPVMSKTGSVEAFEVHPGEAVVIGQDVWHSACRPAGQPEATYFVIFRRGTPQEDVIKEAVHDVQIEAVRNA